MLKPAGPPEEVGWIAEFVEALDVRDEVRVSTQLRSDAGEYVCHGWAATEWLDGEHRHDRWNDVLRASRAFHGAARTAGVDWQGFMKGRTDPWSRATRVAWGEERLPPLPPGPAQLVDEMVGLAHQSRGDALQVVHSDLAGNVLFDADGELPPAIIDISPQFRSVPYAEAVLVADAVAWNGAELHLAEKFISESPARRSDIARAITFRVATAALLPNAAASRVVGEADGYRRLLPLLLE